MSTASSFKGNKSGATSKESARSSVVRGKSQESISLCSSSRKSAISKTMPMTEKENKSLSRSKMSSVILKTRDRDPLSPRTRQKHSVPMTSSMTSKRTSDRRSTNTVTSVCEKKDASQTNRTTIHATGAGSSRTHPSCQEKGLSSNLPVSKTSPVDKKQKIQSNIENVDNSKSKVSRFQHGENKAVSHSKYPNCVSSCDQSLNSVEDKSISKCAITKSNNDPTTVHSGSDESHSLDAGAITKTPSERVICLDCSDSSAIITDESSDKAGESRNPCTHSDKTDLVIIHTKSSRNNEQDSKHSKLHEKHCDTITPMLQSTVRPASKIKSQSLTGNENKIFKKAAVTVIKRNSTEQKYVKGVNIQGNSVDSRKIPQRNTVSTSQKSTASAPLPQSNLRKSTNAKVDQSLKTNRSVKSTLNNDDKSKFDAKSMHDINPASSKMKTVVTAVKWKSKISKHSKDIMGDKDNPTKSASKNQTAKDNHELESGAISNISRAGDSDTSLLSDSSTHRSNCIASPLSSVASSPKSSRPVSGTSRSRSRSTTPGNQSSTSTEGCRSPKSPRNTTDFIRRNISEAAKPTRGAKKDHVKTRSTSSKVTDAVRGSPCEIVNLRKSSSRSRSTTPADSSVSSENSFSVSRTNIVSPPTSPHAKVKATVSRIPSQKVNCLQQKNVKQTSRTPATSKRQSSTFTQRIISKDDKTAATLGQSGKESKLKHRASLTNSRPTSKNVKDSHSDLSSRSLSKESSQTQLITSDMSHLSSQPRANVKPAKRHYSPPMNITNRLRARSLTPGDQSTVTKKQFTTEFKDIKYEKPIENKQSKKESLNNLTTLKQCDDKNGVNSRRKNETALSAKSRLGKCRSLSPVRTTVQNPRAKTATSTKAETKNKKCTNNSSYTVNNTNEVKDPHSVSSKSVPKFKTVKTISSNNSGSKMMPAKKERLTTQNTSSTCASASFLPLTEKSIGKAAVAKWKGYSSRVPNCSNNINKKKADASSLRTSNKDDKQNKHLNSCKSVSVKDKTETTTKSSKYYGNKIPLHVRKTNNKTAETELGSNKTISTSGEKDQAMFKTGDGNIHACQTKYNTNKDESFCTDQETDTTAAVHVINLSIPDPSNVPGKKTDTESCTPVYKNTASRNKMQSPHSEESDNKLTCNKSSSNDSKVVDILSTGKSVVLTIHADSTSTDPETEVINKGLSVSPGYAYFQGKTHEHLVLSSEQNMDQSLGSGIYKHSNALNGQNKSTPGAVFIDANKDTCVPEYGIKSASHDEHLLKTGVCSNDDDLITSEKPPDYLESECLNRMLGKSTSIGTMDPSENDSDSERWSNIETKNVVLHDKSEFSQERLSSNTCDISVECVKNIDSECTCGEPLNSRTKEIYDCKDTLCFKCQNDKKIAIISSDKHILSTDSKKVPQEDSGCMLNRKDIQNDNTFECQEISDGALSETGASKDKVVLNKRHYSTIQSPPVADIRNDSLSLVSDVLVCVEHDSSFSDSPTHILTNKNNTAVSNGTECKTAFKSLNCTDTRIENNVDASLSPAFGDGNTSDLLSNQCIGQVLNENEQNGNQNSKTICKTKGGEDQYTEQTNFMQNNQDLINQTRDISETITNSDITENDNTVLNKQKTNSKYSDADIRIFDDKVGATVADHLPVNKWIHAGIKQSSSCDECTQFPFEWPSDCCDSQQTVIPSKDYDYNKKETLSDVSVLNHDEQTTPTTCLTSTCHKHEGTCVNKISEIVLHKFEYDLKGAAIIPPGELEANGQRVTDNNPSLDIITCVPSKCNAATQSHLLTDTQCTSDRCNASLPHDTVSEQISCVYTSESKTKSSQYHEQVGNSTKDNNSSEQLNKCKTDVDLPERQFTQEGGAVDDNQSSRNIMTKCIPQHNQMASNDSANSLANKTLENKRIVVLSDSSLQTPFSTDIQNANLPDDVLTKVTMPTCNENSCTENALESVDKFDTGIKIKQLCSVCNMKFHDSRGSLPVNEHCVDGIESCQKCTCNANLPSNNSTAAPANFTAAEVHVDEKSSFANLANKLSSGIIPRNGSIGEISGIINSGEDSGNGDIKSLSSVFEDRMDFESTEHKSRGVVSPQVRQWNEVEELSSTPAEILSGIKSLKIYNRDSYHDGLCDKPFGLSDTEITTQKSSCREVFSVNSNHQGDFIPRYEAQKKYPNHETYTDNVDTNTTFVQTGRHFGSSETVRNTDVNLEIVFNNSQKIPLNEKAVCFSDVSTNKKRFNHSDNNGELVCKNTCEGEITITDNSEQNYLTQSTHSKQSEDLNDTVSKYDGCALPENDYLQFSIHAQSAVDTDNRYTKDSCDVALTQLTQSSLSNNSEKQETCIHEQSKSDPHDSGLLESSGNIYIDDTKSAGDLENNYKELSQACGNFNTNESCRKEEVYANECTEVIVKKRRGSVKPVSEQRTSIISTGSCVSDLSERFVDAEEELALTCHYHDDPQSCDVEILNPNRRVADDTGNGIGSPSSRETDTEASAEDSFQDAVENLDDEYLTSISVQRIRPELSEYDDSLSQDSQVSGEYTDYSGSSCDNLSEWEDFDDDLEDIVHYDQTMESTGGPRTIVVKETPIGNFQISSSGTRVRSTTLRTKTILKDNAYLLTTASSGRTVKCSQIQSNILRSQDSKLKPDQHVIRDSNFKTGNGELSETGDIKYSQGTNKDGTCIGSQDSQTCTANSTSVLSNGTVSPESHKTGDNFKINNSGFKSAPCKIEDHSTDDNMCVVTKQVKTTKDGTIVYRENHSMVSSKIETAVIKRTQRRRRRQVARQTEHLHHIETSKSSENSSLESSITTDLSCHVTTSRNNDLIDSQSDQHSINSSPACGSADKPGSMNTTLSGFEIELQDGKISSNCSESHTMKLSQSGILVEKKNVTICKEPEMQKDLGVNCNVNTSEQSFTKCLDRFDCLEQGTPVITNNKTELDISIVDSTDPRDTPAENDHSYTTKIPNVKVEIQVGRKEGNGSAESQDHNGSQTDKLTAGYMTLDTYQDDSKSHGEKQVSSDTTNCMDTKTTVEVKQSHCVDSSKNVNVEKTVEIELQVCEAGVKTDIDFDDIEFIDADGDESEPHVTSVATFLEQSNTGLENEEDHTVSPNASFTLAYDQNPPPHENCIEFEVAAHTDTISDETVTYVSRDTHNSSEDTDTKTSDDLDDDDTKSLISRSNDVGRETLHENEHAICAVQDKRSQVEMSDAETMDQIAVKINIENNDKSDTQSVESINVDKNNDTSDNDTDICVESNISVAKALAMEREKMKASEDVTVKQDFVISKRFGRRATVQTLLTDENSLDNEDDDTPDNKSMFTNTLKKSKSFKIERKLTAEEKHVDDKAIEPLHSKKISNICHSFMNKTKTAVQRSKQGPVVDSPKPSRKLMKWVNDNGKWLRKPINDDDDQAASKAECLQHTLTKPDSTLLAQPQNDKVNSASIGGNRTETLMGTLSSRSNSDKTQDQCMDKSIEHRTIPSPDIAECKLTKSGTNNNKSEEQESMAEINQVTATINAHESENETNDLGLSETPDTHQVDVYAENVEQSSLTEQIGTTKNMDITKTNDTPFAVPSDNKTLSHDVMPVTNECKTLYHSPIPTDITEEVKVIGTTFDDVAEKEKQQKRQELLIGLLNSYYRRKPKQIPRPMPSNRMYLDNKAVSNPNITAKRIDIQTESCQTINAMESEAPRPIPKLKAVKIQSEIYESKPTEQLIYSKDKYRSKETDDLLKERSKTLPLRKSKTFAGVQDLERARYASNSDLYCEKSNGTGENRTGEDDGTSTPQAGDPGAVKKRVISPDKLSRRHKLLSEIAEVEENKDDHSLNSTNNSRVHQPPRQPGSQHQQRDQQRGQVALTRGSKRRSLSLPTGTLAFGEARIVYKNGHFTIETMGDPELDLSPERQTGTLGSTGDVTMRETSQGEYSGEVINEQKSYSRETMHNKPFMKRQYGKAVLLTNESHEDVFLNEAENLDLSVNRCYNISVHHSDLTMGPAQRDLFNDSSSSRTSINSLESLVSDRMDVCSTDESCAEAQKLSSSSLPEVRDDDVRRVMQRAKRTSSFRQAQETGALRLSGIEEDRVHNSSRSRNSTPTVPENDNEDGNKSQSAQNQNSSKFIKKMIAKRKTLNENLSLPTFAKQGESGKDFFGKKMTLKGLFKKNKSDPSMVVGGPMKTDVPSTPPIAVFSRDDDIDAVETPPSSPFAQRDFRRRHTSADIYHTHIKQVPDDEMTDSNCPTPTQERSTIIRNSVSTPSTPIHDAIVNGFNHLRSSGPSVSSFRDEDSMSITSSSSVSSSLQSPSPLEQPNKPKTPKPVGASPRRNPSFGSQLSRLGSQSTIRTKHHSVTSLENEILPDNMKCECIQQKRRSQSLSRRRKKSLNGSSDSLNMCQYCKLMEYHFGYSAKAGRNRKQSLPNRDYVDTFCPENDESAKQRKHSCPRDDVDRLGIMLQTDVVSSNSNDSGIQRDVTSSIESVKATAEGTVKLRRKESSSPRLDRPKSEASVRWADGDVTEYDAPTSDGPVRFRQRCGDDRPRPKSDFEGSSCLSGRLQAFGSEVSLQPYCSLRNLYEMRRRDIDRQKNRRMSTPHPIKSRLQRSPRKPSNRHTSLVRSNSMPDCLDKLHKRRKTHHLLDFHMDTLSRRSDQDDCLSDDSDLSFDQTSLQENSLSVRSSTSQLTEDDDNLTYAEALWDHITMDPEELGFRAQDVIEVTDMADKDWWFGCIEDREGWFPATFVRIRVNQDAFEDEADTVLEDICASPNLRRISAVHKNQARSNVVNEIISAEREYVKHLKDVVEGYIQHARKRIEMFPEERIQLIFGNIETIYSFACKFVAQLETCIDVCPHLSEIGQCFLDNERGFEIYSDYCNNHPSACEELKSLCQDSKYKHFFEACRLLQELVEIPLEGFLLTPVQKICKYPLQLAELLKYTPPDHPDYKTVRDALSAMRKIATLINERKRKMESIEKIAAWQHSVVDWAGPDLLDLSSELIFSGELTKVNSAGWSQDRYFFLFDHQLIYCKKELLKRHVFSYKGRIDLDNCEVLNVEDGKDLQYNVTVKHAWKFHETQKDKWYLVCAKTAAVKERWLKAIQDQRQRVLEDQENDFCVPDHWKQTVLNKVRSQSNMKEKQSSRTLHGQLSVQKDFTYSTLPRNRTTGQKHDKKKGWFKFVGGKKSKR